MDKDLEVKRPAMALSSTRRVMVHWCVASQKGGTADSGTGVLGPLFGQSANGRYLLVVLVNLGKSRWKIATAREMADNERRLYRKTMGGR